MSSEYDAFLGPSKPSLESSHLDVVRAHFREASLPYTSSPLPWFAWAIVLPASAFATPFVAERFSWIGVLLQWSLTILLGGAFEIGSMRQQRGPLVSRAISSWVFGVQANLSLVAIALSCLLLWQQAAWALPGLWLLLLGHSFAAFGGLSFPGLRQMGLLYQLGGFIALWPSGHPLLVLGLTTFVANMWMATTVLRRRDT